MKKSLLDSSRINAERLFSNRFTILTIILSLLTALLFARIYYLQVINYEHFDTLSKTNRIKYIQVSPRRGIIYDRNNIVLADNKSSYSIELNINNIKNLDTVLNAIKEEIRLSEIEIKNFYKNKKKYPHHNYITLKRNLSEKEVAKILSIRHRHDGLEVTASLLRKYPYNEITQHIIGSVGFIDKKDLNNINKKKYKNSKYIGKTGVEKYYEKNLFGSPGYKHVEVNARGRQLRELERKAPISGEDIHLTIDINLQKFMYSKMKNYEGSSVAINPKNGEILAMVSVPSLNPNNVLWKIDTENQDIKELKSPFFNRSINGLYSPGSTIKPIVALNSLHNNIINAKDEVYAGPFFKLPNNSRKFRDWKPEGHGTVNLDKAIVQSCDVYFYIIAHTLGIEKLASFFKYFSFGKRTGIDLPNESKGILPSNEWKLKNVGNKWTDGDTVITGIGQGYFSATPLQLAHATSIIANKGLIIPPKINKKIFQRKSKEAEVAEKYLKENISEDEWNIISNAMFNVVNKSNGTAYWSISDKKNNISGKTGTVQVYSLAQDNNDRDNENIPKHLKDHSLYIGYAPKENPEIVIATIVENIGSGSKYAAPISNEIINFYLDNKRYKNQ